MVDAFLSKKYKLDTSENFDDLMKALGVGLVSRKMGNAVSPVVDLAKNGDEYTLTSVSTFKTIVTKFKPGVEKEEDSPDGRKIKSTFSVDGNTIREEQKDLASGKTMNVERTWSADEVKMVMKVDDITCTRIYKAQA